MKRSRDDDGGAAGAAAAAGAANQLEQLKAMTTVVADTGEFEQIAQFKPQDVTTNPSLIYKASVLEQYAPLLGKAVAYAREQSAADASDDDVASLALDKLFVLFGVECLKLVEGRVSTEVDARLSYDEEATVQRVLRLKRLYEEEGIDTAKRVLFKIASTWEGIKAAERLERDGVHCNLTLLFSFEQAVACAEARVTLISPFVGRILDYWKKERGVDSIAPADDPGVLSVTRIYKYYKRHGYATIVMGASFRSTGEVLELAGVDYLTLSPKILEQLAASTDAVQRRLEPAAAAADAAADTAKAAAPLTEAQFRWGMCQDPCATVKLAEGIRNFAADIVKVDKMVREQLAKP